MIINGKQIKEICAEGGYDSRFDDVVISLEDGSSILIQGDFSITSLESGQKVNEAQFYSANPSELENGMSSFRKENIK